MMLPVEMNLRNTIYLRKSKILDGFLKRVWRDSFDQIAPLEDVPTLQIQYYGNDSPIKS